MSSVRVKICGITRLSDARLAVSLGAWAIGFVFYRKSSRAIEPAIAASIRASLPDSVRSVGVFVDSSMDEISECVRSCAINTIQLHGSESDEFCSRIKDSIKGVEVYKALRVRNAEDFKRLSHFPSCDAVLLDAFVDGQMGGTGHVFDWSLADHLQPDERSRLIVSGGLRAENVSAALKRFSPFAVDVSSGVELQPGIKSEHRMRDFFAAVHGAI